MVAVINVFYRGNEDEKILIEALIKYGIVHYVDSTRFEDSNWVSQNCKKGLFRCFDYEYDGGIRKVFEELKPHKLDFSYPGVYVLIVDCKEENPNFYNEIKNFLEDCFIGTDLAKYMDLLDMHTAQGKNSLEQTKTKRSIEDSVLSDNPDQGYSFEFKKVDELDCMFYQLTRPNTDRPYVVLVKNYSKHGSERLFSSMRMFDSWGASRHDISFLHKLWEHLGGKNGMWPDFDQILEDHVKACLEGEEEPKVWRNDLDTVVTDYIRKHTKK